MKLPHLMICCSSIACPTASPTKSLGTVGTKMPGKWHHCAILKYRTDLISRAVFIFRRSDLNCVRAKV
eukprot:15306048-Ditylum_brightwellii.AAC.1